MTWRRARSESDDTVSAYRLASFRVAFGLITLLFHVPQTDGVIRNYFDVSFHQPMAPWIPGLAPWVAPLLIVARHLAAVTLVVGVFPRASALGLALSGAYIVSLDRLYYSNHVEFHLTLLLLLSVARHRVGLSQLLANDDAARTPQWPERLLRLQVAVMFFYAGLSKLLSPAWGTGGAKLLELTSGADIGSAAYFKSHQAPLVWLEQVNTAVVQQFPGVLSVVTIGLELFISVALLAWRRSWVGVAVAVVFAGYLEFFVQPRYFMWDVVAALLLFVPVGDRRFTVFYDETCRLCRGYRAIVTRCDWFRRLAWRPLSELTSGNGVERLGCQCDAMILRTPRRSYAGFDAVRHILLVLPAPFMAAAILVRAHGGRVLGVFDPGDVHLIVLAGVAVLWLPGFSRFVGQPLYRMVARRRHGHTAVFAPTRSSVDVTVS